MEDLTIANLDNIDYEYLEYLKILSQYVETSRRLEDKLKKSFMNLSSARSIVGHKNISPDQYDMRIKALTCVDIGDSNTILLKSELPKINKTFGGSTIHQKGSGDSTKVGNELNGQSQTLRNRKNKKDAQPEAEKKKITDPITMFGLLPPKPLKDSQAVFQSSLEEIIELANLQVKLMEKREYVTELKQKLKNLP
ncbi:Coiled-coil domain-containing protein [Zancudomyces culisetae]|uniref:Vacuolar ATPase assembly protein VMA22 n=1 Tax=Zancudomyces culisetae TaxID=1213189 RepID=A0A1R1PVA9_ZANCU|nr:Coiled-coil domain-containing protein [Zancudomyces culisetae]|eukprot:OMH84881.1 Coiled-coil domain-containing protein [Zancudomyces culisetae]